MTDARPIVLGYDGRPQANDALELARELAALQGAKVIVVSCFPYDSRAIGVEAYERRLHEDAAPLFAAAAERLGEAIGATVKAGGSPAEALTEVAGQKNADLIVVGSTHRGVAGRVYPGSIGERLLESAPCAVAISPRDYATREPGGTGKMVGVGYDASAEADRALVAAGWLAAATGEGVQLIHVLSLFDEAGPSEEALRDLAQEALRAASVPAIDIEVIVETGPAADALTIHGVVLDLLVIGSRSYGKLRRAAVGGTSAEVIRTAPCPVIVLPRSAGEDVKPFARPAAD